MNLYYMIDQIFEYGKSSYNTDSIFEYKLTLPVIKKDKNGLFRKSKSSRIRY